MNGAGGFHGGIRGQLDDRCGRALTVIFSDAEGQKLHRHGPRRKAAKAALHHDAQIDARVRVEAEPQTQDALGMNRHQGAQRDMANSGKS